MAWAWGSRVGRADGVLTGELDGRLVVFQPRNGEYAGLDGTAFAVWERLSTPQTFGCLVDTLTAAEPATHGAGDIAACLDELLRQGLVEMQHSDSDLSHAP